MLVIEVLPSYFEIWFWSCETLMSIAILVSLNSNVKVKDKVNLFTVPTKSWTDIETLLSDTSNIILSKYVDSYLQRFSVSETALSHHMIVFYKSFRSFLQQHLNYDKRKYDLKRKPAQKYFFFVFSVRMRRKDNKSPSLFIWFRFKAIICFGFICFTVCVLEKNTVR